MSKYVLDSYAWVDYLEGTKNAQKVRDILADKNNSIFTHKVSFAEVISVTKRRGSNPEVAATAMTTLSQLYEGTIDFYKEVGLTHAELRKKINLFGLADTFVVITARKLGAKIITGDQHFKGMKEVGLFLE